MSTFVGLGGARRNVAAALVRDGRLIAALEQERLTRTRADAYSPRLTLPLVRALLQSAGVEDQQVTAYAVAEPELLAGSREVLQVGHAEAHAAAAFAASGFEQAAVLVCDGSAEPVTAWRAGRNRLERVALPAPRMGLAAAFAHALEALGMPAGDEHRFETLARVGDARGMADVPPLADASGMAWLSARAAEVGGVFGGRAALAAAVQDQIAREASALASRLCAMSEERNLCLAGGVFYNTRVNSEVASSGGFDACCVPPHPGNPGLAVGAALLAAEATAAHVSDPFLGPEYDDESIKRLLDNCKLSYEYAGDARAARAADAISRGMLVGWFTGRMEWGPRALGHRSILANPLSPHVLANLNSYLKQGVDYRTYGILLCEEDAPTYLRSPARSRFMEFEAESAEHGLFRGLLPHAATRLRYQTVSRDDFEIVNLLRAVGERTGHPVVVNTSLNGFQEPIACSPRDAVRIFYGTGLDMLVLGNFVLRK